MNSLDGGKGIVPCLWFNDGGSEACGFYCSVFPKSRVLSSSQFEGHSSNTFELWGERFEAITSERLGDFSPAISFMVNFDPLLFSEEREPDAAARSSLDQVWAKLSEGGTPLMELGEYDFSARYGWIQDRFGVSWQLILSDPAGEPRPAIIPSLLFVGDVYGRAEEATDLYRSLFDCSERGRIVRYPPGGEFDREGTIMFSDFRLGRSWFTAMDSGYDHKFQFNDLISFVVPCENQNEVDRLLTGLSSSSGVGRNGWLKDRFGISWQIRLNPED